VLLKSDLLAQQTGLWEGLPGIIKNIDKLRP
jgi:hypothetical protein